MPATAKDGRQKKNQGPITLFLSLTVLAETQVLGQSSAASQAHLWEAESEEETGHNPKYSDNATWVSQEVA